MRKVWIDKNEDINFEYLFTVKEIEEFIDQIKEAKSLFCDKCQREITEDYYFILYICDTSYVICPKHYKEFDNLDRVILVYRGDDNDRLKDTWWEGKYDNTGDQDDAKA